MGWNGEQALPPNSVELAQTDGSQTESVCAFHQGPPDVEISQHLQVDDGFGDAFDAVVVKV